MAQSSQEPRLRRSVFARTSALLLTLCGATTAGLSGFALRDQERQADAEARAAAAFLAAQAQRPILWDDRLAVRTLLQEVVAGSDLFAYAFVERAGRPYAHTFERGVPAGLLGRHDGPDPHAGSLREFHSSDGRVLADVATNISAATATVHVGLDRSAANVLALGRIRIFAAIGLTAGLICVALAWPLSGTITHRLTLAEKALDDSEQRYRRLFDQATDGIVLLDTDDPACPRLLDANRTICDWLQVTIDDIRDSRFLDSGSATFQVLLLGYVAQVLRGQPALFESELRCKDGNSVPVEVDMRQTEALGKPAIKVVCRDLTERRLAELAKRRLEERTREAQQLRAVAQLAGGVAHGINNVLGAIAGAAGVLRGQRSRDEEPAATCVRNIEDACHRGKGLTSNLLGFARRGRYEREAVDFQEWISQSVQLLQHEAHEGIRIDVKCGAETCTVVGDRAQLTQALLHVGRNALDALSGGGRLLITTGIRSAPGSGVPPARRAWVQVCDSGGGMDPETLSHVFEPFFTTKAVDTGAGLGLPMVYGTMQHHGGSVTIDSTEGVGTTVTLELPADAVMATPLSTGAAIPSRTGTILLVDDEPMLLWSYKTYLQSLGYRVLVARNGIEALEVHAHEQKAIDLVLLDLLMPEMNGFEAFRRLKQADPGIRIIISTGYSDDDTVSHLREQGALGFLAKPVPLEELAAAVARGLASPASEAAHEDSDPARQSLEHDAEPDGRAGLQ